MEKKIIYEVLRVIEGKPLFLEKHLERLERSFALINQKFSLSYQQVEKEIKNLIKNENKVDGNIKITYTVDEKILRVFFIEHFYPTLEMYKEGVETILYFGERENPNAKIINDNFRERVTKEIKKNNAYEAILVDSDGNITEGSKSNIFMVKDNTLITSPVKSVLPGVTRGEIIEIAQKVGIEIKEVSYKYSEISELDGMFISGTSPKILPIKKVNNISMNVNDGIIRILMKKYDEEIALYIEECKKYK